MFEKVTLKKIADHLRNADSPTNESWFVGLIMKFLPFLFFKNLLNDCETKKLKNNKKMIFGVSFLDFKNATEADNSRISCGYSRKTVRFFKGRGLINLT